MVRSRKKTVRARGLGVELKELRANTGLSTTKVGELLGWSASTISRIETGNRGVTSEEVAAMLVIYKPEAEVRERLIQLAREVDKPGWWETGDPGLPKLLNSLIGFETQASRITIFELRNIPGLLQTPEYARAIMAIGGIPSWQAETRVATRIGRQALLTKSTPPELVAIIDESVLRRPVGGHTVMNAQIKKLITEAQRPNITIQVVPFAQGGHIGLDGAFVLLDFPKARSIVHLEHKTSGMFLDEPEDTEVYLRDAATLRETALSPQDSAEYMTKIADEYKDL